MSSNGLYVTQNRVAILDMAQVEKNLPARPMRETPLTDEQSASFEWSVWGADNLKPQQMADDIKKCGSLTGIVNMKSRLALCEGIIPAIIKSDETGQRVIDKIVDDPEIWKFLEASDHFTQTAGWMKDIVGMANAACRFMFDKEGKNIVAFQRDDITELRYAKKDKEGKIHHAYYSAEWDKVGTAMSKGGDDMVYKLPLLRKWAPWDHAVELAASGAREMVTTWRYPGWGEHYYSTPLWYSAYKWVKYAQALPEFKAALIDNVMRPAWIITIYKEFWRNLFKDWDTITDEAKLEEKRQSVFTTIDQKLSGKDSLGNSNAGKNIYIEGELSMEFGKAMAFIEFKALDNPIKDGELLMDGAAANSEIAFAEMMNLVLMGGNQSAGPYTKNEGGSNIREASLFLIILTELERRFLRHAMMIPIYVNKWDVKYPGMEFIIPATSLTTLDTGAGSKPITTGGIQSKPKENGTGNNNTAGEGGTSAAA